MKTKFILVAAWVAAVGVGLLANSVVAAEPVRLCTGSSTANYYAAGNMIKEMAGRNLAIEVVTTDGTIDNIGRVVDKKADDVESCDAMIGQPDGPVFLARQSPAKGKMLRQVASLHREYLHVLCNKASGVDDLSDLASNPSKYRIAIGPQGSGAWLIWQNIINEDKAYAEIPVSNEGDILALSSVSSGDTTCMLIPAGLGNGIMREADATFGDTVVLVGANDRDFDDALDIKGAPLYEYAKIPGSAYPKSFDYWSDVKTISWNAGVYINSSKLQDADKLRAFVTAASRAANGIKAEFGK